MVSSSFQSAGATEGISSRGPLCPEGHLRDWTLGIQVVLLL